MERIQRIFLILAVAYVVWLSVQAFELSRDLAQLQVQVQRQEAQVQQQHELVQSAVRDTMTFSNRLATWQLEEREKFNEPIK